MRLFHLLTIVSLLVFSGCSKMVLNKVSDGLSGGGSNFMMKDNDPEFVAAALPLALKMYEGLIEQNPEHIGLHQAAAAGFAGYSYAFLHFPADTLVDDMVLQKHLFQRAHQMYLRAKNYGLDGLEIKYPGFKKDLRSKESTMLLETSKKDCDILYWTGMAWLGAFSTNDISNFTFGFSLPQAIKLLKRVEELNPDYSNGALDEFFITLYGSLPPSLGGDPSKVTYHYDRAIKLSGGKNAGPYIAYAQAVSVPKQDVELFRELLGQAKKIKPNAIPDNLLLRTLQKRKAEWLLAHEEDYFLLDDIQDELLEEALSEEIEPDSLDSTLIKE